MTRRQPTRRPDASRSDADLANEKMGRNSLQGDDQESVRNQRKATPDVKDDADEVMESFTKMDKNERARQDLNKGATRGSPKKG